MLRIGGTTYELARAEFSIRIRPVGWDYEKQERAYGPQFGEVAYMLDFAVAGFSGGDGEPAPSIQAIPVFFAAGQRHPSLAELGTLQVAVDDEEWDWDAWYGNDAPKVDYNCIDFLRWQAPDRLRLRWTAEFEDWRNKDRNGRSPIVLIAFEGDIKFTGIWVSAHNEADHARFLQESWGGQPIETLRAENARWMPEGHWFDAQYFPIETPS